MGFFIVGFMSVLKNRLKSWTLQSFVEITMEGALCDRQVFHQLLLLYVSNGFVYLIAFFFSVLSIFRFVHNLTHIITEILLFYHYICPFFKGLNRWH